MNRRIIFTITMAALSAVVALAQGPRTPPTPAQMVANRVAHLTALLTLTTAQQASASTIFTTEETTLSGIRSNMETVHNALKTAVEAHDTAGISSAANQVGNLTTQQVIAQAGAESAFLALLTADQKTKYEAMGPRGRGGRGGPGGMPGMMPGGPHGGGPAGHPGQ
jgi:Spy/CpxP family protein refolding chaperone